MKFAGFLLFIGLTLFSCGSSSEDEEGKLPNNFHVEGKIIGAANKKILIKADTDQGSVTVAETMADASGNYTIDGNIPALGLYSFVVEDGANTAIVLPMTVDDKVTVSGNLKDFSIYPKISGTSWAKPLMWYMKALNDFSTMYMIEENAKNLTQEQREAGTKAFIEKIKMRIIQDPGNQTNIVMVSALFPLEEGSYADYDKQNIVALDKMRTAYQKKHASSPFTAVVIQKINGIIDGYENYYAMTSGTLAAPEISLPGPDGKQMRLSDLKGKVVLIDFWASWCQPCRAENPNVVRLYKKYHSKGFEIFSVSLDTDPELWKKAIATDGLLWKNHASDLMGWNGSMIPLYQIQGIPHTVLVNKEGNIIGLKLRGEQLEQKLEELFGK